MQSATLLKISATLLLFGLSACATQLVETRPAASCASLIPESWREGVQSAPLPSLQADKTDWQVFSVEQTGQLDKANGRTRDSISIVEKCEARDAEAVKQIQRRPWWAVFG